VSRWVCFYFVIWWWLLYCFVYGPSHMYRHLEYKLKLNSHADHTRAKQQRKHGGGTMMVRGMIGLLLCIVFSEIDSGKAMYSWDNPPCQK